MGRVVVAVFDYRLECVDRQTGGRGRVVAAAAELALCSTQGWRMAVRAVASVEMSGERRGAGE